MPLQNRVDPFGDIHAEAGRGLFTGNRGVIHDPETKTLLSRRWTTKAWIICTLVHPRGKKREAMGRNTPSGKAGWTELFFLDEVTALAAGHRPCFYCRRDEADAFRRAFSPDMPGATAMDAILHAQRTMAGPVLGMEEIAALPDGSMIAVGDTALTMRGGKALRWGFSGYRQAKELPDAARLLTPRATVEAFKAGYRPVWHGSGR